MTNPSHPAPAASSHRAPAVRASAPVPERASAPEPVRASAPVPAPGLGRGRTAVALVLLGLGALLSVATSSQPPVIEQVTPALGDSAVALDAPVEISFEAAVDPDTVDAESVALVRVSDGQPVRASLALRSGDRLIRLVPDAPLAPETDYEVRLDLGRLASRDGEAFVGLRYDSSSADVWETEGVLAVPFTTRSTLQVARAFRASESDEILVYFSEPVAPDGVTLDAVQVRRQGALVPVDLRYSEAENRLRILPLSPLDDDATYVVELAGSIRSMGGSFLGDGAGDKLSVDGATERIR